MQKKLTEQDEVLELIWDNDESEKDRHCEKDCEEKSCGERDCEEKHEHKFQTHVHEIYGSVRLAERCDPHEHRFAGMSCEAISVPGGHIHRVRLRTDYYEDHYHEICVLTGLQDEIGCGRNKRHVHFLEGKTSTKKDHSHKFIAATLIENPTE